MLFLKYNNNVINISLGNLKKIEFDYSRFIIHYTTIKIIIRRNANVSSENILEKLKDIENVYEIIEYNEFTNILEGIKND